MNFFHHVFMGGFFFIVVQEPSAHNLGNHDCLSFSIFGYNLVWSLYVGASMVKWAILDPCTSLSENDFRQYI